MRTNHSNTPTIIVKNEPSIKDDNNSTKIDTNWEDKPKIGSSKILIKLNYQKSGLKYRKYTPKINMSKNQQKLKPKLWPYFDVVLKYPDKKRL